MRMGHSSFPARKTSAGIPFISLIYAWFEQYFKGLLGVPFSVSGKERKVEQKARKRLEKRTRDEGRRNEKRIKQQKKQTKKMNKGQWREKHEDVEGRKGEWENGKWDGMVLFFVELRGLGGCLFVGLRKWEREWGTNGDEN